MQEVTMARGERCETMGFLFWQHNCSVEVKKRESILI